MKRAIGVLLLSLLASLAYAADPKTKSGFFTTSDGVRLHYLEAGRGPGMVFVPGWTMPGWIWEAQIQYFAARYHVVALDPRSQGESQKTTAGNSPERRAQDIKELVDHLRLGPAVLVGWSLAVSELMTYAERFGGETVRAYVLVDGFVWDKLDPDLVRGILDFFRQFQTNRREFTERFVRSMYKKPQPEGYLERVVAASLRTPADSAIAMNVGFVSRADWRPAMAKLDRPVLIISVGGLGSKAAQLIKSAVPSARMEAFEDAGHALFVDDADRFNQVLEDFLAHLPPTPANP